MKKVYILDLNILTEQNISLEEFIVLLSIQDADIDCDIKHETIQSLQEKDFIKIIVENHEEIPITSKKGRLLINLLTQVNLKTVNRRQIKKVQTIPEGIDDFVKEFRSLWKGLKPGSMGSQNACRDKMIRWMETNPDYNQEDILKASKVYLRSLDNYRYLQNAEYFIYKKDENKVESSRLSAFIDENDSPQDEWSSNLN